MEGEVFFAGFAGEDVVDYFYVVELGEAEELLGGGCADGCAPAVGGDGGE